MVNLTIGNSTSTITGLTVEQFKGLRDELSSEEIEYGCLSLTRHVAHQTKERRGIVTFKDAKGIPRPVLDQKFRPYKRVQDVRAAVENRKKAFIKGYVLKKTPLINRKGEFPTGLLYLANRWLIDKARNLMVVRDDRRICPKATPGRFKLSLPYTPYLEQIEAARACRARHRGIVVAPTGVGKSAIAALMINELQVRTLLVVPTLELRRQITEGLQAAFPGAKVGSLAANSDIAVENVDALDPKEVLTGYDCVIIDEFHHSGAATYRTLNKYAWPKVFFRFGLTATPFRSKDSERLLLESVLSEVIYEIPYALAVKNGYIVPLQAYYVDLPKQKMDGSPLSWQAVYSELIVQNEYRNKVIAYLLKTLFEGKVPTLVLVKEIKHGEILSAATGAAFANGQSADCQHLIAAFNQRKLTGLIGTTGILGEGVDSKPAEVAILAAGGRSKNAYMQQCGRTFRVYPGKECATVFIFRDSSHKWLLEHFEAQVRYLREEYGVEAQKLDLPEDL